MVSLQIFDNPLSWSVHGNGGGGVASVYLAEQEAFREFLA